MSRISFHRGFLNSKIKLINNEIYLSFGTVQELILKGVNLCVILHAYAIINGKYNIPYTAVICFAKFIFEKKILQISSCPLGSTVVILELCSTSSMFEMKKKSKIKLQNTFFYFLSRFLRKCFFGLKNLRIHNIRSENFFFQNRPIWV
jgi:hypothetical protein